ncbi:YkgJ family cysteine cluster protein [Lacisediminimonas sp.]|uniref:YkgJ family cysteine cluster protein n=1 Tax=Lacisediminimonas sp. TaxID=3060582 RepID=UPI002722DF16|nr:YkgJ family cysteine cluster protein [Lacisediminimonas sp.]MDO8298831.1 YkgJ family cysteine cluster protein [Lacisediminimonas sp.]
MHIRQVAPDDVINECRSDCGACCIAPSISSPIPGMPDGKPAGMRCIQLDDRDRCRIFGQPQRPAVCGNLRPEPQMCGANRQQAIIFLQNLEFATRPST